MTCEQKDRISFLRSRGLSYTEIGIDLGIPKNTVKTYCRRHNLGIKNKENLFLFCRECGKPLKQAAKRKKRLFCSKECREKWWHTHPDRINKKAVYKFTCACCGKEFTAYGNSRRKFCSHDCYIEYRFKDGETDE